MRKKRKWLLGLILISVLVIGVFVFLAVIRNSSFYLDASKVKTMKVSWLTENGMETRTADQEEIEAVCWSLNEIPKGNCHLNQPGSKGWEIWIDGTGFPSINIVGNQLVESGILEKVYELTEEDAAQIREEIVGIFTEKQNKTFAVRLNGDYGELLSNTPEVHLITDKTELLQDTWWKRTVEQSDNPGQESAENGNVYSEREWSSRYSDSWFETHALAEILFRCGSSTPNHEVKSVVKEGNVITVQISRYLIGTGAYDELPQDEMETSWNILVELIKEVRDR